ncbi:hypothetical protein H8E77_42400 [bacterium]|nr:hypothetical protein [bacterium]
MKERFLLFGLLLLSVSIMQVSCFSVPHLLWPQKDIQPTELNEPSLERKVLVASRSSEFKDAVVQKIGEAFKNEPVYVKFIGLEQLEKEDGANYAAVVLINKSMSWDMDRNVKGFLKRHKEQSNMIVLTTSGDGEWLPKMKGRHFDAISSASQEDKIDEIADEIISKVRLLLQEK